MDTKLQFKLKNDTGCNLTGRSDVWTEILVVKYCIAGSVYMTFSAQRFKQQNLAMIH